MRPCPFLARQNFASRCRWSAKAEDTGPSIAFCRPGHFHGSPDGPAGPPKAAGLGATAFPRDWLRCTCVALLRKQLADQEALPLAEPTYSHLHSPDSAAVPLPRGGAINPSLAVVGGGAAGGPAMSHFGRSGPPDIRDTFSLLVLNISFRERDLTLAPSAPPRGRPL